MAMPRVILFNRPPPKAKPAPKPKPPPAPPNTPSVQRPLVPLPPEPEPSVNGNGHNSRGPGRPDFTNEYQISIYCHCAKPLVFATPVVGYDSNEVTTCSRCGKRARSS